MFPDGNAKFNEDCTVEEGFRNAVYQPTPNGMFKIFVKTWPQDKNAIRKIKFFLSGSNIPLEIYGRKKIFKAKKFRL